MIATTYLLQQPLLVQFLLKQGRLKDENLPTVQEALGRFEGSVEDSLIQSNLAGDDLIAQTYSEELHLPLLDGDEPVTVDHEIAEKIGEQICREHRLVPVLRDGEALLVACANPTDLASLEEVQLATGLVVSPIVASVSKIDEALGQAFGKRDIVREIASEAAGVTDLQASEEEVEAVVDLDRPVPKSRDSHVVRLVNHLLSKAIDEVRQRYPHRAVRAHREGPLPDGRRTARISPPPRAMYVPIVSRLKILAKMDIAERRIPQDGSISLKAGDKRVDLRVNTVPTVYGEKMVMRILAKGVIPRDLTLLGFSKEQAQAFQNAAESPHGLLLVTGPTGSGKSTTLYAVLNLLNKPNVNTMTIEDPVEYKFEGLNQVHVRSQVGLTFASALRAFLRQDPDIIMVGEIRDQETAQICLRAALTGHMVLSTLHTNDARPPSTVWWTWGRSASCWRPPFG